MTRPADIYLRFLNLVEALKGLPSLPPLDPVEERILAHIARLRQTGESLSVRQTMALAELGSPATVHTRLTAMRKKGWVQLDDTEDARRKNVQLTQAALDHFDRLSQCLVQATQAPDTPR